MEDEEVMRKLTLCLSSALTSFSAISISTSLGEVGILALCVWAVLGVLYTMAPDRGRYAKGG